MIASWGLKRGPLPRGLRSTGGAVREVARRQHVTSLRGAIATKQPVSQRKTGLLRFARNDGVVRHPTVTTAIARTASMMAFVNSCFAVPGLSSQP
jgi:hypothetical protein